MNWHFLFFGKKSHPGTVLWQEHFLKKWPHPKPTLTLFPTVSSSEEAWDKVKKQLLPYYPLSSHLILLDPRGALWDTEKWSTFLEKQGKKKIFFAIGPHMGWQNLQEKKCLLTLSFSPLTFSHEMAQLLLFEQLYRIRLKWQNHPYARP